MIAALLASGCAKARVVRRSSALALAPIATSSVVVTLAVCFVPLCLGYIVALEAAEAIRSGCAATLGGRHDG